MHTNGVVDAITSPHAGEQARLSLKQAAAEPSAERAPSDRRHHTAMPAQEPRAEARSRLIELIARQLVHQTLQERNASLPVRPIQH